MLTLSQKMRPFFYLLILTITATFVAASNDRDSQLLLNFKASLPDQSVLQNWVSNQDPCSFNGVTCRDSRVSSIELSYTPLSTDFHFVSTFLLSLENLESLSLSKANISGNISFPSGSNCSPLLTTLDLSENTLSGPLSAVSNLGSCQNLNFLNLSSNGFEFSKLEEKTRGLQLNLEVLDLSYNKLLVGNVVPWLLYGGCSQLKVLALKGNKINGDINVSNCKKLKFLDLSANNFSTGSVPSFGDCSALTHLDVSANKFSFDIGRTISSCVNLNFLNVSNNQFTGRIPALPASNLQYLNLADNNFQGPIPLYVTEACSTLVELDLSLNNLSGVIPSGFASCSSLESFQVSTNNFTGKLPIEIFQNMSSLKKLDLGFNYFSGPLPDTMSSLFKLEVLDLSSNNFSGSIPGSLCENPASRLQVLHLQNNILTGSIPASLGNCSELVSLHLSFNYLRGKIPASLGTSLSKLKDLKLWLNQLHGEIPQELSNIQTLETLILDFNELSGAIPSGLSNCTKLNWISLSNNRFTGEIPAWLGKLSSLAILKLSNNSFYGSIPPELGDCRSLIWLDLNTNNLNGSIPSVMFKQSGKIAVNFIAGKRYMYIKNDGSKECHGSGNLLEFAGIRQEQLDRISTRNPCNFTRVYGGLTQPTFNNNGSMLFLDLSYNALSGSIPKEVGTMSYLFILNLGHNDISGTIPTEIGNLKGLGILDLSYNRLEGSIPQSMTGITLLSEIDLSNNLLSGLIPESGQMETFPASDFVNNAGLCGVPLPACVDPAAASSYDHRKSHRRQASLAGSVAMGLLLSLFCIFGAIVVILETKKRRKKHDSALDVYMDSRSHSGTANTSWKLTGAREALSINLSTFEKPLRKLTFAHLLEATNGFHNDSIIGSGGFGDVYKAKLKDGNIVAIKKLIHISGQGDREFTAEMETIGKIKHRNLVPLLGYCKVGEERLLVYEYMMYGSLEDVLHGQRKAGVKLNWAARRKIAIGAARGLAFLHHKCTPHIIHRDMKSSNVLLDENLEARVSDFGMARLMSAMDTHLSVSTLAGTPGYVPPEYYQSFRCSTKGDVYSYGVVLLELLTGRRPTDSLDFGDNNIVGWVKQHAKLKISDVFDPELMKEDPDIVIELLQHLNVACACLDDRHWKRPTMFEVMAMFKAIQAGSGLDSQSTIATDDGAFNAVEMSDMTIKEVPEGPQ